MLYGYGDQIVYYFECEKWVLSNSSINWDYAKQIGAYDYSSQGKICFSLALITIERAGFIAFYGCGTLTDHVSFFALVSRMLRAIFVANYLKSC